MSSVPFMQVGPFSAQATPSDGETMVHGLFSEDFLEGIFCPRCAEASRRRDGYDYVKYAETILAVHGDKAYWNLLKAKNLEEAKDEFLVCFSGQATPGEDEAKGFVEKLARWNQRMKQFAEGRGQ